jgi:hypothetical protein
MTTHHVNGHKRGLNTRIFDIYTRGDSAGESNRKNVNKMTSQGQMSEKPARVIFAPEKQNMPPREGTVQGFT